MGVPSATPDAVTSWHYEYTLDSVPFRFGTDSLGGCITGLIGARTLNRLLSDVKIFEGGTLAFGSGTRQVFSADGSD
jgi:hypothetical protein